ncbi:hypothetical protein ACHQM5_006486 [Ranunculus cassubicifolius]
MDSKCTKGLVAEATKEVVSKVAEKMEKTIVRSITSSLLGTSSKCNEDPSKTQTGKTQGKSEDRCPQQNTLQTTEPQKNSVTEIKKSPITLKQYYSSHSTTSTTSADPNAKNGKTTYSATSTIITSSDDARTLILIPDMFPLLATRGGTNT